MLGRCVVFSLVFVKKSKDQPKTFNPAPPTYHHLFFLEQLHVLNTQRPQKTEEPRRRLERRTKRAGSPRIASRERASRARAWVGGCGMDASVG